MELLERDVPFAQLAEHVRQAAAGHGRLVLIGGEAGIGKSALVEPSASASRMRPPSCARRVMPSPRPRRSVLCVIWRRRWG